MQLRKLIADDFLNVEAVASALPQWFTEGGIESIRKDLPFQFGLVAEDGSQIIGFITYFVNQGIGTIGWMGVLPAYHRTGVGSLLLSQLQNILEMHNIHIIEVSTLGDSVDYEPYARTRSFYRKNGFVDHKIIQHPDNPEQEEELILRLVNS